MLSIRSRHTGHVGNSTNDGVGGGAGLGVKVEGVADRLPLSTTGFRIVSKSRCRHVGFWCWDLPPLC